MQGFTVFNKLISEIIQHLKMILLCLHGCSGEALILVFATLKFPKKEDFKLEFEICISTSVE